ncbi:MAG: CDP-diacylglycerol--glycerol-3-phosphate 3-phosphatidyltransferase [Clostridia bacterium]|nr:CDP-diacylglycerol--glycerol-3-phosphate 3-phosphatidyltransferase [Clostridia bacterium]
MNLPNKITLTRIFMIPVFVVVFYLGALSPWCYLASAVVFLLAALTDALDGHIARSRNLVTNLGKFLDPIADKVLVSTAFIILLTKPVAFLVSPFNKAGLIVAGVCVAVILARELIVSGFRMIAAGRNLVLAADKLGKIKTTLQDVCIAFLLVSMTFLVLGASEPEQGMYTVGRIFSYIGLAAFALCTIFTVISGVNYIVKNKQVLKDEG